MVRCWSEDKPNADDIDKTASHFKVSMIFHLTITGCICNVNLDKNCHVFIHLKIAVHFMKIDSTIGTIDIADPSEDQNNWIIIKSQSVTFDKSEFFIKEFTKDFSNYKLLGSSDYEKFTFLSELCGRMPAMTKWFAATSIKYSDTTQLPLYLKQGVAPDVYNRVQKGLLTIKKEQADIVDERDKLAKQYAKDLEALKIKEANIVKKTIGDDNILKIVSLTTECLPLSIQMKIQSYMANSSDADVADNRRRLAQEYLALFKSELININNKSRINDIDALIEEIQLK
jgi:hypothetical protein